MKTISPLTTLAVSLATTLFAQDGQAPQPDSLHTSGTRQYTVAPVVVTATRSERPIYRVPFALDVLEQKDVQRAETGLSLDEALRGIPGVLVNNRYNLSQGDRIAIRGIGSRASFGVRGIRIILDGIPLTMADGQAQLNNLDLGSAGKIEIIRGPSSSLYGNAAGGLIHIQTQEPPAPIVQFQPQLIAGSHELRKLQGKVSGKIDRHAFLVNANVLRLEGYREHAAAGSAALNAIGRHQISNRLRLTTVFNYFDAPYLLNPSSLSKADAEQSPTSTRLAVKQQGAGKKTRQGQAGVTLQYDDGKSSHFEATAYGLSRALLNPIPGRIIDLDRMAWGVRTAFSRNAQWGKSLLRWTIGMDYEAQDDARVEFDNNGLPPGQVGTAEGSEIFELLQYGPRRLDQSEEVIGIGPLAELELAWRDKLALTLGGRYDRYKFNVADHLFAEGIDHSGTRIMEEFSPMAGLIFHLNDAITAYASYATAFQTPTTTELSNQPAQEGGFNPALQPERMHGLEFGLKGKYAENRFSYDLALYSIDTDNMLIPYQIQNPASEEVFYRNAGKARNRGVEMKLEWFPVQGMRASLAYTFMHFVFKDFLVETSSGAPDTLAQLAGNDVPGVPPSHLFAGLAYEHKIGAYAEANLQWLDRYFANDFNGPPPGSNKPVADFVNDAYWIMDMRLGWRRGLKKTDFEIFCGANNLFDQRYNGAITPNAFADRFFEPAPGRSWYLGVSAAF
jgi:iron complex outermembrane receptor protein